MRRRDWFITCGQLAGTAALGFSGGGCQAPPEFEPLPPAGADEGVTALPPDYLAAVFEPREDRAIVWLGARAATAAHLELWPQGGSLERVAAVDLTAATGFAAALELRDLTPDTEHRVRPLFESGGPGPWLGFRTAPAADDLAPVSFLFSGDVGNPGVLEQAFAQLASQRPPFYVHLGDWPYVDGAPAARSVEECRARHRAAREPAAVQEWMWSTPVVAMFDDHDVVENWAGLELAEKDPGRLASALQVWREYFPFAGPTAYRELRWGALAHLVVVDTRSFRDRRDPVRDRWTMLGDAQLAWLTTTLRRSDAAFKILVSTVPFGFDGYEDDDWSAFPAEREAVLQAVREAGVDPLVVISADRHWFAARHLEAGVREYQVGPLTAGLGKYPDSFPPNVVASALTRNFGRIDIVADATAGVARLTFTCFDLAGAVLHTESAQAPIAPRVRSG